MNDTNEPAFAVDLQVCADRGQIYIYSPAGRFYDDVGIPELAALEDATSSRRFVDTTGGLVDLMTPGQWNWATPMRVEVWPAEPPTDYEQMGSRSRHRSERTGRPPCL